MYESREILNKILHPQLNETVFSSIRWLAKFAFLQSHVG